MSDKDKEIEAMNEEAEAVIINDSAISNIFSGSDIEALGISDPHRAGLYKIFRSDQRLTQEEISFLLGIHDTRHSQRIEAEFPVISHHPSVQKVIGLIILAFVAAGFLFFAFIYFDEPKVLQANPYTTQLK
jgi:hypothetical protein